MTTAQPRRKPGPKPGTPTYRPPKPIKERILTRIVVDDNGCWVWQGPKNGKGYGHTFIGSRVDGTRRNATIHRLAYEEWIGPIPEGLTIDHLCENTSCCNPAHLDTCTAIENKRRATESKGACRRGHPWSPENTYIRPNGSRGCRVCKRITTRRAEGLTGEGHPRPRAQKQNWAR